MELRINPQHHCCQYSGGLRSVETVMSTLETESDFFEGPHFSGLMVTVTQSAPVMLPFWQQLR